MLGMGCEPGDPHPGVREENVHACGTYLWLDVLENGPPRGFRHLVEIWSIFFVEERFGYALRGRFAYVMRHGASFWLATPHINRVP